jgi:putative ABC transport system permease protein
MRLPFAITLALREGRSSARRLATYMIAITVGVAALVAINSFRANVVRSVDDEAKNLLGADLRLNSNQPFPDSINTILDSIAASRRGSVARVASTISIAVSSANISKLVQLRGVYGPYPLYGTMETEPRGLWNRIDDPRSVLVEPTLLAQMSTKVGDSLRLGGMSLRIAGVITNLPTEVTFRNALGPRVYMAGTTLDRSGLLKFGSIARHEAFVKMPDETELQHFVDMHHDVFRQSLIGFTTAREQAEQLAKALDALGRFLGLVGLAALLLGGLGVASAINVFIKSRRDTIAVLRCIGATQRAAFIAYLLQAVTLGIAGAAVGVLIGLGIQAALPALFRNVIPYDVHFRVEWSVLATGLVIGAVVTTVFALLPLLEIRGITPLRALRHSLEPSRLRDPARWIVYALVLAAVAKLSVWQAGRVRIGLGYTAALGAALLVLWLCALLLVWLTRRFFPKSATFTLRQGVANLHRPQNQTLAVTIAVGFGVFLMAGLWVVQRNILDWIHIDKGDSAKPNVVLIDVQPDQIEDMKVIVARYTKQPPEVTPIVPGKVAAVNGITAPELLAKPHNPRIEPWAVRREYRHTYRARPTDAEKIVEGKWWSGPRSANETPQVSVEEDLLKNLGAKLGDPITWDIQGAKIETVVTSVRQVDWARFDTNFFVVFQPGVLESAPQTYVALVHVDSTMSGALQRELSLKHANISAIDVGNVQRTLERIVGRVAFAVRSMALFSVIAGAFVLLAALAAGRYHRIRESALLRTLGATRAQLRRILITEYVALGTLAGITGVVLGGAAGWMLIRFVFKLPRGAGRPEFVLPITSLAAMWIGVALMSALMGLYTSRDALNGTPLEVLRENAS